MLDINVTKSLLRLKKISTKCVHAREIVRNCSLREEGSGTLIVFSWLFKNLVEMEIKCICILSAVARCTFTNYTMYVSYEWSTDSLGSVANFHLFLGHLPYTNILKLTIYIYIYISSSKIIILLSPAVPWKEYLLSFSAKLPG